MNQIILIIFTICTGTLHFENNILPFKLFILLFGQLIPVSNVNFGGSKINTTNYKIVNNMKRYVTRLHTLRFTHFSVAFLFWMLSINSIYATSNVPESKINESRASYTTLSTTRFVGVNTKNEIAAELTQHIITLNPSGPTNIKLTSATIDAMILAAGNTISERGVCWGTHAGVAITDHKSVEGGLTAGTFSLNITGLDKSKTIYYKAYFIDENGTNLSDELSFSNIPVFSAFGDWIDPANWNVKEVPGITPGDSIIIDANCTTDNLTINAGTKVTVLPGRYLIIRDKIINNAGLSGLIIKSDAINHNATFAFKTGSPEATVEMYSKAKWDLYQADGSKYSWQFFGIPVKTFTMTDAFLNSFIRKYDETATTEAGLWINQSSLTPLISGIGYEIVQQKPTTYSFAGTLTNEDFYKTLNYLEGTVYPGQHILANPYTAAIDISLINYGLNTEKAVYLYNTGTYNQWVDNGSSDYTGTTTAPGQYTVSTPSTTGTLGVPGQIPSMQGFLVKTSGQAVGSITIPYYPSLTFTTDPQRSPSINGNSASEKVATRIDLSGSHFADCMWIFSDPTCTTGFDNGWDGYKIKSAPQGPQIYAMESTGDFQIDAVADENGTSLGFNAGAETDYKLTFTHQNTNKLYQAIYLVDLLENKTTDITITGSEYSFTAISTPTPVKRFKIVTDANIKTGTPNVSSLVKIFNSNGILFVQNQTDHIGSLTLFNLNGVAVKKTEYKANEITTISTSNLLPGAYVAKASTNQEMVTEKIIIR